MIYPDWLQTCTVTVENVYTDRYISDSPLSINLDVEVIEFIASTPEIAFEIDSSNIDFSVTDGIEFDLSTHEILFTEVETEEIEWQ